MGKIIITFSSVTYALKAKKILARAGISAKVVKVTAKTNGGCTHGVEIFASLFLDAINEIKKADMDYSIYQPQGKA